MKTTKKQLASDALKDTDKAISTFRIIKDKLQLESCAMTDKTVFYILSQKEQVMHLTSIMDDYLERLKKNIGECAR